MFMVINVQQWVYNSGYNNCTKMGDSFRVSNIADVVPSLVVFRKMAEQCCPYKTEVSKYAVSIPVISMRNMLKKSLEKDKKLELIHQEAFVTYIEINDNSFITVVAMES